MKKSQWSRAAVIPAVVLGLSLAGCAHAPSTAATVGGQQISESEVTEAAHALSALNPRYEYQSSRPLVLAFLVREHAADAISRSKNVQVTDTERVMALGENYPDAVLRDGKLKQIVDGHLNFAVLRAKLGNQPFGDEMARLKPELNPRYGTWDNQNYQQNTDNPSLSTKYPEK